MTKRYLLFVLMVATICWVIFIATAISCLGAENKNTSSMTSKEIKIRNQKFKECLKYNSRSYCYYLYF